MLRVFIVDEIRLVCEVMARAIKDQQDMRLVGCATNLEDAIENAERCDVLLVSSSLSSGGALALARTFKSDPSIKVVVVGLPEAPETILRYMEAGAAGYVCRENSIDQLLETIRSVHKGKALISPELAAAVIARVAELADWAKPPKPAFDPSRIQSELTSREQQVLALVAQGLGNQEIAERLTIELGTAKNHVHKILQKMNVKSREEAAACMGVLGRSDRPMYEYPTDHRPHLGEDFYLSQPSLMA